MIQFVHKKDGSKEEFDAGRIYRAVLMAIKRVKPAFTEKENIGFANQIRNEVLGDIERLDQRKNIIDSSTIQELVEERLMMHNSEVARLYIEKRHQRDIQREGMIDIESSVMKVINKDQTVVNENANKDSNKLNVLRDLTSGSVAKSFGLKMLPKRVANAHIKGDIHFHDLDYHPFAPMTNCCLIDFKGMFEKGFRIGNAEVESPKSINTAVAQTSQIIANVSSMQYGGCSFDRADEVLAPYALMNYKKHLKDAEHYVLPEMREQYAKEKTIKDIYDSIQSLEYEVNTLYNSNGQTPFFTLGFGLGSSWIEREIQKSILQVRIEGLGAEKKTAIFPKLVFSVRKGHNLLPTDPNYDIKQLALKCSTKRMYPDILNYDKLIELTGSFKAPMGCRSFLQGWKDENDKEINSGRMNLGVTTLNLPRIAMLSKGNMKRFWKLFNDRMEVIHEACEYRVKRVKEATPNMAPILYRDGAFGNRLEAEDSVWDLFKDKRATLSVGYIGLYEVGSVFFGGEWEKNPDAKEFTLSIVKELKSKADSWGDELNVHVSIYSTPSESLTDRFCRLDREKFGIVENITDKEYYTNSFHYDVRKNPTPFEKLDFEKDYPKYCSGGFIHYCEYPVLQQNPKALEAVWDYSYDKVGYLGTNTPIDRCHLCNFEGDFKPTERGFECPKCGNTDPDTCDVVKRTCGYLGNPQARPMVNGRHKEISARVKHMKNK